MNLYDIAVSTLDEKPSSLADHRGKALLIVNVASECGYTPQYAGLQKLHEKYAPRGFAVLGFPSNDFGAQEPGTNAQIQSFCSAKFRTTFPMYAKIPVKGSAKHPLYKHLTEHSPIPGEVAWNFEKFLVSPDGKVAGRFISDVEPESAELAQAIEAQLK